MILPETFDISAVHPHHALLLEALSGNGTIAVDASQVGRADAAAMQLLAAAALDARRQDRRFEVINPSSAFTTVARALGLDRLLDCGSL